MIRGVNLAERIEARFDRAVAAVRRRSGFVDHLWRAGERYSDVLGGRLAAAISYYAFFAAYSLGVLAYSIVGRLLGPRTETGVAAALSELLEQNLPWVAATARDDGRGEFTTLAALALVVTGVGWIEALRSSMRAVWLLNQHPGHWTLRRLVDLGMLAGLGLLLTLSLLTTSGINRILDWLAPDSGVLPRAIGPLFEFVVNLSLAAAMLTGLSRLRLSVSRWLPAALLIAVGIQLLNTVGRLAITHTQQRPAYAAVAGAVGLLIYLFLLNQVILFGTAIAATARYGTAMDLGQGRAGLGGGEAVGGVE